MSTQICQHCGGQIVEDVCEDCGRPAAKGSLIQAGTGDAETPASQAGSRATKNTARFTVNYPTRQKTVGAGGKTSRRRTGTTSHTSTRRTALGGGLISLPDQPSQDPLKLLMAVAEVPDHKRHCPSCDSKVNRSKGFCPSCGASYDFEPHLKPGDRVFGKYEVKGAIAFGGLGWIYLGWDTMLSRWVVLKGLLNAKDEASAAAAVAERQFLAAVKHPKIVGIYDFVNHQGEGYIIMEYVGGVTVHSIRKQKGPLPPEEAIAYILGILPAFSYLHAQGMVYCDFKPDNIMLEGGDVKLIDMGAVRKIGDPNGDIFGTPGFMAPEADDDPRAVSDLYTIGRGLATLLMDFKYASEFESSLPTPGEQSVLANNESLYRFLLRATHQDPDERFQTADEMADQLFGVLREIVALKSDPKPADSKVFTAENGLQSDTGHLMQHPTPATLPSIRVDLNDRATSEVMQALAINGVDGQLFALTKVAEKFGAKSTETRLRIAEILIHNPDVVLARHKGLSDVDTILNELEQEDPFDWRPHWLQGVQYLYRQQGKEAMACFERTYFEMPGEIAPRLAMGYAAELAGLHDQAIQYYDRVGRVDPGFITANFGLARCYAAQGQLDQAISALQRVPQNHNLRTQALLSIGDLVLQREDQINTERLKAAEEAVRIALVDGGQAYRLAANLLACVVRTFALKAGVWQVSNQFLGFAFAETPLRVAAESYFRKAAKLTEDDVERRQLVMQANAIRPVTLF